MRQERFPCPTFKSTVLSGSGSGTCIVPMLHYRFPSFMRIYLFRNHCDLSFRENYIDLDIDLNIVNIDPDTCCFIENKSLLNSVPLSKR
jgi:hypothetical protein